MQYISTRGTSEPVGFTDVVLAGLAPDGGLYIPDRIPDVQRRLDAWRHLSYPELAYEVVRPFVEPDELDVRPLIEESCAAFDVPDVAPVVRVGDLFVLELFHGPTLAFKDVALQWLGRLFARALELRDRDLNILAATSGDTGSAAIAGVRGRPRIRIFVLHPRGRISPLQERQMTTVLDENVHNLAVDGTFDDGQRIMKTLFADVPLKERLRLGAVNSVNWARILAQIVYYFHAAFRVQERTGCERVRFSVPTGNFGDILAGWYAVRMGLPVDRLILATNSNDILSRFFQTGAYSAGPVSATLSPSMDIQAASNFERYLFYRLGRNPEAVREAMNSFARTGTLHVPVQPENGSVDPLFLAGCADTAETLAEIRHCVEAHGYCPDPHTAVGLSVARRNPDPSVPTICLATAHPAKFPEAVQQATGQTPPTHPVLDRLADAPTRRVDLPADPDVVRAYLEKHIPVSG